MKIGIQQSSLFPQDVFRSAMMAARAGAEGLGINLDAAEDIVRLGYRGRPDQLRRMARSYDLAIMNFHLGCLGERPSLIGEEGEIAAGKVVVRMALWAAAETGVPTVVVPFFRKNRIEFDHELHRAADALAELSEEAERVGVTLAAESDLVSHNMEALLGQAENDRLKIALNTGHLQARRFDLAGLIRKIGADRLHQVLLRDVRVVRGLPPQFDVRLGRGDVDFGTVARTLQFIGFDDWIIVDAPPGDESGMIAAANIAFARGVLAGDWVTLKLSRLTRVSNVPEKELTPA